MARSFTWERAPFETCPACEQQTFGVLSAGGDRLVRRCTRCRYSDAEQLPAVDKKVIYLDQFVFSQLFKVRAQLDPGPHAGFWQEADQLVRQVLLLQQAVFPHSDLHHSETLVSPWPRELRQAYEDIGGDVSLEDTRTVQLQQIAEFARAYIEGREPCLAFDVDDILKGKRNAWLRDMRVSVNTDYGQFAEATRQGVVASGESVTRLIEGWRQRGLGFEQVLELELGAYQSSRIEALQDFCRRYQQAVATGDFMAELNLSMSHVVREMSLLRELFSRAGVAEDQVEPEIFRFWAWPQNREQPFGRILAHLFAALAGQVRAGRRSAPTPGFMNDVSAISAYAPFVDAMFVDKECAALLGDGRVRDRLTYSAHIFSMNSRDEFLGYLRELESAATPEVREYARTIYGA